MSDLARFLPLSHRSPDDAEAAPADRRAQIAEVIALAAAVLRDAPDERIRAFVDDAGLSDERRQASTAGLADRTDLADLAGTVARGRQRGIRDLTAACRAYLRLPGDRPPLPFDAAGAVALAASTSAPFARRAAISGHTVRATDAGWTFGRGPEVTASADEIVAFLTGVSDTAPRRRPLREPRRTPGGTAG